MDGFKDSTKIQYMRGGSMDGHAKGSDVKGAAKVSKVMGEFKRGDLHSGSKKGPEVKNPKQAMAIALSEAGKSKAPVKKGEGGMMGKKRPSAGESVESGNRMSKMMAKEERMLDRTMPGKGRVTEQEMRMLEERFPIDRLVDRLRARMPSAGESVASGNRMSKMEAEEARAMGLKKGGLAVMPKKGKR
jgi:hypothetical protein